MIRMYDLSIVNSAGCEFTLCRMGQLQDSFNLLLTLFERAKVRPLSVRIVPVDVPEPTTPDTWVAAPPPAPAPAEPSTALMEGWRE